jgi:hypothetical protein
MAKGMESNVSDDESDTTSLDDLVELVHEKKGMLKKQANQIKELNTLNDLSATLATNYERLLSKFKLLSKKCDELKAKLESNETITSNSFELDETSIPCAIPISIGRMPGDHTLLSLDASHAIPTRVLRFEVSRLRRRTPVRPVLLTGQTGLELLHLRLRFFGLGFVDQPRN